MFTQFIPIGLDNNLYNIWSVWGKMTLHYDKVKIEPNVSFVTNSFTFEV